MVIKLRTTLFAIIGIFLLLVGCIAENGGKQLSEAGNKTTKNHNAEVFKIIPAVPQQIGQIRGIGYPGNDTKLYVATNRGLKFYDGFKWLETSADRHNFQSFQAAKNGFFASGHPEKGTGLKNPLGLVESSDKGKSLRKLAFYGESNFHFLAASYAGNSIYVIQEQPVGKVDRGVYYSTDGGKHWQKSRMEHFTADSLGMMAVHPQNGGRMAVATRTGIYYSNDHGNTMKRITGSVMITALTFLDDDLLYSSVENKKILLKTVDPGTGKQSNVVFPFLDYDNPVTYLTIDSKNTNKIAFTTYKNDLYESTDGGKSWNNLLINGEIGQE